MDFNPQQFFDNLSQNFNVFDGRNAINRGVTAAWKGSPLGQGFDAIGTGIDSVLGSLRGGPLAAEAKPLTDQEIKLLIQNNPGLTDQQIATLWFNARPEGGKAGWTSSEAQDQILRMLNDNQLDREGVRADADLRDYTTTTTGIRDSTLAAMDDEIARSQRIVDDPNQIRTDAQYGQMLRQAEQALQGSRIAARNQGASISAARGGGFSGAGLGLARQADMNATNQYTGLENTMLGDIRGGLTPMKTNRGIRAGEFAGDISKANRARIDLGTELTAAKHDFRPTYNREAFESSIAPRLGAQSESQSAFNSYAWAPIQHAGDSLTAILSNSANQLPSVFKGLT